MLRPLPFKIQREIDISLSTKHWKVYHDNQTAWKPANVNFLFLLCMNDDDYIMWCLLVLACMQPSCLHMLLNIFDSDFPQYSKRKTRETQNWKKSSKTGNLLWCSLVWVGQKCLLLRLHSQAVSAVVNKHQMMEDNVHQAALYLAETLSSRVAAQRKALDISFLMLFLVCIIVNTHFQLKLAKVMFYICGMEVLDAESINHWLHSAKTLSSLAPY